jgi:hypothetical protein
VDKNQPLLIGNYGLSSSGFSQFGNGVSITGGLTATGNVIVSGNLSVSGSIENVARTNIGQTFTGLQVFSSGLSSNGITGIILTPSQTNITAVGVLNGLSVNNGLTVTGDSAFNQNMIIKGNLTVLGTSPGGGGASAGVVSLNGLSGSVTISSGSNVNITQAGNTITVASLGSNLAGSSVTGVAAFPNADFSVSSFGAVSLTGNVARTHVNQTFAGRVSTQALNVVAGATFGNDIYAPNMVTGVNGITGAVSITSGTNVTITQSGKTITIASTSPSNFSSGINVTGGITSDNVYSASGYEIGSSTFLSLVEGYTLTPSDDGKVITINSATPVTLTGGTAVGFTGFSCTIIQLGAGQVTVQPVSVTINSFASAYKLAGQHSAATLLCYSRNTFNLSGNLTT